MTDEITPRTPNEEPAPAEDEMPTAANSLVVSQEAIQPMTTDPTVDEMVTITMTPDTPAVTTQVTPVVDLTEVAPPIFQSPPPTYEQFGMPSEPTHTIPYPDMVMQTPQSYNQALYAQNAYVPPQYTNPATYTQDAYPLQPSQPFTAQPIAQGPAPKTRNLLVWMILIALIAFLLGGGSVFAYSVVQAQAPSPNPTLQKYCDGVNTANAQEIYDTLSQQAKAHVSLNDIQSTFDALTFLNSLSSGTSVKYGNCTTSNLRVSGSLAVSTVTISLDMTLQGQNTTISTPTLISLVLENNQWKIDFSSLAQPQPGLFPTPAPN